MVQGVPSDVLGIAALGLPTMAYGVIYSWWMVGLGAAVTLIGVYGWALEPSVAE